LGGKTNGKKKNPTEPVLSVFSVFRGGAQNLAQGGRPVRGGGGADGLNGGASPLSPNIATVLNALCGEAQRGAVKKNFRK